MHKKGNNVVDDSSNQIRFSFEYYDDSGKYCLSKWKAKDIKNALLRLGEVNTKNLNQIFNERKVLHFHEVNWNKTKEKNGFPSDKINNLVPFQFSLLGINNQRARVYGGLYENTFYIVWFDLDHKVYPSFKKHT